MGNKVDQSHADYKNSLDGCANFLPWWLVWEPERRCRWTRLRMARPQPRLWLLRPPLPQPSRKSPRDLCVSVKGLVTGRIFIQGGGRKKGNIRGVNTRWKIGEKQLTPLYWGGHCSPHPSWMEVSFLVWPMAETTWGTSFRLRRFRKMHLENILPRGSRDRDPRYPKGVPWDPHFLEKFFLKKLLQYVVRFGGYMGVI